MNSARTRFLRLARLRSFIGNKWCGSDLPLTSLQSTGNLCLQRLHDLANQDRMKGGTSTPLTLLQRDLETLINAQTLHSKKDIVSFLAKAKTLLATSESFLSKEQLLSLLERVGQLGSSLEMDQIKGWSLPFWTAMSYQLTSIAKSCHICDISRILAVYVLAFPEGAKAVKGTESSNEQLFSKLMSVLDLRLRQTEGKSHLTLGEMELKCMLSIFSSVADLNSCSISTPLIRRLLIRMTSNPQFWTEDHILLMLDCLEGLKYEDLYSKFSAFVVNKLTKKEVIDQHKLCQIVKGLSVLRPRFISSQKLNSILWSSLSNFEELENEELVDLLSSLAKLKVIVEDEALRLFLGHLFLRTSACTPSQLSSVIFSLSVLPETSVKSQMCSATAIELTKRVRCFTANDLAKIMFGFCRLHFHPREECISKVISHSLDILLEDEIIQTSDTVHSVESYNEIEYSNKMQGMIARAQLDELRRPFHFTNRTKLKHLRNAIANEQCPENASYQKQQYDNFKGYELAALVFALAQIQIESIGDKFFDFVKEEIMRESIPLDVFELTFALWGIALSGHLDKRLLFFALDKIKDDDEKDKHQIKIRMAKSTMTLMTLSPSEEMIDLESIPYLRDCYKLWLEQECSPSVVSPIIHEAMQLLRKTGFDCELRCQLNHGMCVADVIRGVNGQTFAMEVRPVSFDNVENHIPGESRWRLKILEAAGCTVLYIKSMVWESMDENHKIEYLKRLTGML